MRQPGRDARFGDRAQMIRCVRPARKPEFADILQTVVLQKLGEVNRRQARPVDLQSTQSMQAVALDQPLKIVRPAHGETDVPQRRVVKQVRGQVEGTGWRSGGSCEDGRTRDRTETLGAVAGARRATRLDA